MTISSTSRKAGPYSGNDVATAFPFSFKIFNASDLTVVKADPTGAETVLTYGSDYSVTMDGDQDSNPGGTVTLPIALASSYTLTIGCSLPYLQQTDFTNQGGFYPKVLNSALDRLTIYVQQLAEAVARSLKTAISTPPGVNPQLPSPVPYALIGWNVDGTGLQNADPTYSTALATDLASTNAGKGGSLIGINDPGSLFTSGDVESALQESASFALYYTAPGAGGTQRLTRNKLADTVSARDYGAVLDGVTNDSTKLTNAAAAGAQVIVDGPAVATNMQLGTVADTVFRGQGSLVNAYRKRVIPDAAPGDGLFSADLDPRAHLKQFNKACGGVPKVVLMGDSISTYMANSIGRGDMLADVLRRKLDNIAPNGIEFYNRAIGGKTYADTFSDQYQTYIPWYAGLSGTTWINVVKALNPDLVILSFGMNDTSNISAFHVKSIIDEIKTWTKVPSIVLCTNLVPNPSSASYPEGTLGQEGRDSAAGFIRSYAKYRGVGLLDFHRKVCMVRDGFDPFSSCLTKGDTVAAGGGSVVGTKQCYDWKARLNFNGANWGVGDYVTFKTGSGGNDFMKIIRSNTAKMLFATYAGGAVSIGLDSIEIDFTWPAGSGYGFTVEKVGNHICIYQDTDSQYGSFNAPLFFRKIVSLGGLYYPTIMSNDATILVSADFSYGEQRVNLPSIKNSLLWGNETPSMIDTHGGSGWNHPGGFMATHVYRPVVDGANWGSPQFQSGWASVASGITTMDVTFPVQEADAGYYIMLTEEGAGLGRTMRVTAKTVNGFTIGFFGGATLGPGGVVWQLFRQ